MELHGEQYHGIEHRGRLKGFSASNKELVLKIHELLARDPRSHALANSGQARINTGLDERAILEVRAELETFVCDGQYGNAIERILSNYLKNLSNPRQDAAWVSGFFGSGKSHLLKMLGHLWVDTEFDDGSTARSLVQSLPDEVQALLRELDTQVARSKHQPIACAGTLPAGRSDFVKMTVLSVILGARDLPKQYPQAEFCFWLKEQDFFDRVRGAVEDAGKDWLKELNNLYVSGIIANAILECDPNFASSEKEARQTLRARFPNRTDDITTDEFLSMTRKALSVDGELPLTILVLDEVQQYIGDYTDRAVAITELTEAICTQLDSKVMLVQSGQSALSATPQLQKLKDRYRITAQLSDTDVEAVTRKVLLRKKASGTGNIKATLEQNAGEISKHLSETRIAERSEDARTIVEDYPLLPTRRRFWEECFKAVDAAGTQSQLRSQLRILHDSLIGVAESDLGYVLPGDALYDSISANLVNTGVLLNEIELRIRELDDGTEDGRLRKRICGLVFLIGKLPREGASDLGVRATARTISDLMVENITIDNGPLRQCIETELSKLSHDGTLMQVGDEYRLQTTEGAEWDRAYREKVAANRNQEGEIAYKRDQMLGAKVQEIVGAIRLLHGEAKEKRFLFLHAGNEAPTNAGDQVVVWLRDGWNVEERSVTAEARQLGLGDPVLHLFLPRKAADNLKKRIVEAEAARQVIDLKGIPSSSEGREARESMQSRYVEAQKQLEELLYEIVGSSKLFQGGGTEVFGNDLRSKLEVAANDSLGRLFPRFADSDHRSWGVAVKRAREGGDQPLNIVGWEHATEDHPVVRQVLLEIGNGAKGNEVRKALQASPFGWPKDAIDTGLIGLHSLGTIRASANGQPILLGHLDQNNIPKAEFHLEKVRLSAADKLTLRGLFQKADVSVRSGEEEVKAKEFLSKLKNLADQAGGDAPMPAQPSITEIDDLSSLTGSEQLKAILEKKESLELAITDWQSSAHLRQQREPVWNKLLKLCSHATSLPVSVEIRPEIDAILSQRSLLQEPDQAQPLVTKVANALRTTLKEHADSFADGYQQALAALDADQAWQEIEESQREALLQRVGIVAPKALDTRSDENLILELDRSSLEARMANVEAFASRVTRALEEAAKILQPEAKRVAIRAATLNDEAAVKIWIAETERKLLSEVNSGPVIVG